MMRVRAVGLALILGSLAIPGSHARPPDDFDASDGAIGAPPGFVRVARPARPAAEAAALSALGAEGAARRHLKERAADYRLRDEEVLEAIVDSTHDTGRGAIIVTFRRQVDGVDVFRDEMRFAMDRGHELVAISGYLTGSAREPSGRGAFRKRQEESIAAALADLTGEAHSPRGLRRERRLPGGYDAYAPIAGAASRLLAGQSVRIRKVYFRLADRLEAAHHLELEAAVPGEPDSLFYAYVISAEDGRVLLRKNLTADADFSYRVWADPSGDRAPL
ncbi:MAG TPA: hypothetical protein VFP98_07085, partial [Candidatus Polarisedimenticolia bacterium]|nr:hypothetical protein [Candidatus Polarisedimenticolia bacterium]